MLFSKNVLIKNMSIYIYNGFAFIRKLLFIYKLFLNEKYVFGYRKGGDPGDFGDAGDRGDPGHNEDYGDYTLLVK